MQTVKIKRGKYLHRPDIAVRVHFRSTTMQSLGDHEAGERGSQGKHIKNATSPGRKRILANRGEGDDTLDYGGNSNRLEGAKKKSEGGQRVPSPLPWN